MNHKILLLIILSLCLTLTACTRTAKQASRGDVQFTGFLGNYNLLRHGSEVGSNAIFAYENPNTNFRKYDSIIIDPVSYWSDQSKRNKISAENAQFLVDEFYYFLVDKLSKDYRIVTLPGKNTMRLQVAITNPEDTNQVLHTLTSVVPVGRIIAEGREMATGRASVVGSIGVEAELSDAMSGETLYMVVDKRFGRKTMANMGSRTRDAEQIIQFWATNARNRLCTLRGAVNCNDSTLG